VRQRRRQRRADREPAERAPSVESPRTDEEGVSAEGREQPVIEPEVEAVPAPVEDAPDTTTQKQMHEDPTKLEQSGDESAEGARPKRSGRRKKEGT
jgi:hypothetical protein